MNALRERMSRLSAAVLRVSASLDVNVVLQEVVANARELTSARYGIITTVDEAGQPQAFITSGLTEEERTQMARWPDGPRLFEHFRNLPEVVRLDDLPDYARKLGFSTRLMMTKTFQSTPMRYQGTHVGSFFLGEKEDGQTFTDEDEEVLVLFASQAATAIANARAHHDERQARAHLEALVETSPVGVVVCDAHSGRPVSLNRTAARIVEGLCMPGLTPEQLMGAITCRRGDGRELPFSEIPIVRLNTVGAEEVELSMPDGRSIKTLINVTPVRSTQGEVLSAVITLQDLAKFEELERSRAQFLALVSHELRTPLAAIKGSASTMLGTPPPLDPSEAEQMFRIIDEQTDHMRGLIGDLLDAGRIAGGTLSVTPEPMELISMVEQARNAFQNSGSEHAILIDLPRTLPPVLADKNRIVQVLSNLLANAMQHSPVSSPIQVTAVREGEYVEISIKDKGHGMAAGRPPRSLRKLAPEDEGSGLGLSICKGLVKAHGGRIWATSAQGRGTQFAFTIPVAANARETDSGTAYRPDLSGEDSARASVLVVDDDPKMLRFVRETLSKAGYSPITTTEYQNISQIIAEEKPKLILLDLMLPGTDGIELMESVPELADVPVIFISAYGRDETIAKALESGAIDYLVKPFSSTELTARIRAALRRHADPEPFVFGDLTIDYSQRRVSVAGRDVHLTTTEYELLHTLSENTGRVVTFELLIRRMWRTPEKGDTDRVRTFVKQIRRKLGDDASRPAYIVNVRGVGYRMKTVDDP